MKALLLLAVASCGGDASDDFCHGIRLVVGNTSNVSATTAVCSGSAVRGWSACQAPTEAYLVTGINKGCAGTQIGLGAPPAESTGTDVGFVLEGSGPITDAWANVSYRCDTDDCVEVTPRIVSGRSTSRQRHPPDRMPHATACSWRMARPSRGRTWSRDRYMMSLAGKPERAGPALMLVLVFMKEGPVHAAGQQSGQAHPSTWKTHRWGFGVLRVF
jgi:hypothetical protein